MDERFLRSRMLLGAEAMSGLASAHVAVLGLGGVGSWCAEALARSGVGTLTIVDRDVVTESNINRQSIALCSTIGRWKTDVCSERLYDICPDISVRALNMSYSAETRDKFFSAEYDYIIDAIDLVSCKLDLIETAIGRGIPIISALGTGNKLDCSRLEITDISKTSGCPLARIVRKELRKRSISRHTVLYSSELAMEPESVETPPPGRRSVPGSVVWVPACAGLMLAGHVVLALAGASPN